MILFQKAQEKYGEFKALQDKMSSELQTFPKGRLRPRKKGTHYQYYLEKGNSRQYIPKQNMEIAKKIARRDYIKQLLPALKNNMNALKYFIIHYKPDRLEKIHQKLPDSRKVLVSPIFLDTSTYAAQWQSQTFERKQDQPDGTLLTMKNEPVRSKSEVIIANLLNAKNIPYHYEFPLKLKNGVVIHPDFYCLNTRTRQTFYWEHFGMMDTPDYASRFVLRLSSYSQNNIFPGKNLLITTESSIHPLETRCVEKLIETFLI